MSREKKLANAKAESLQEQLSSSQAETTSHSKGKEDLMKQISTMKEEAAKFSALDRTNADLKTQLQDSHTKVSEAELRVKQAESALAATTRAKNRIELDKDNQLTQVNSQLEEQVKLVDSLRDTIKSMQQTETMKKAASLETIPGGAHVSDALTVRVQTLESSLTQERKVIQQLTT